MAAQRPSDTRSEAPSGLTGTGLSATGITGTGPNCRPHLQSVAARRDSRAEVVAPARGLEFHDLLLLGALACQAPAALVSVRHPEGSWSTLSYGFDVKDGLDDRSVFEAVCAGSGPVELPDVAVALPRSPLGRPPHSMRWAYGVGMRIGGGAGPADAAVVVLDRWLRRATRREERALSSLARRLSDQLAVWRSVPAAAAAAGGYSGEGHHAGLPSAAGEVTMVAGAVQSHGSGRPHSAAAGHDAPNGNSGAEGPTLLRSQEVARLFDVTERTVINWAASGRLPSLRTIGGHLRFRRDDVLRLLAGTGRP